MIKFSDWWLEIWGSRFEDEFVRGNLPLCTHLMASVISLLNNVKLVHKLPYLISSLTEGSNFSRVFAASVCVMPT